MIQFQFIFVLFFNLGINVAIIPSGSRDGEHGTSTELFREDASGHHCYYNEKLMFRQDDDDVEYLLIVDKDREDLCGWTEIDGEWLLENGIPWVLENK